MAIQVDFGGWFQCRLATDSDSFNEKRGRFGWTFAYAGEPDLDRIIRCQSPVALRSHANAVGVNVKKILNAGTEVAGSPLLGAKVDLLDNPVFEGRNGQIATSADEPVVPLKLHISQGNFSLVCADPVDLADPADLLRRKPVSIDQSTPELIAATGISSGATHFSARLAALKADRTTATDPTVQSQLDSHIAELQSVVNRGSGVQFATLLMQLNYEHQIAGPNKVVDPDGILPTVPIANSPWQVEYFFGGWDFDALCGYLQGSLHIPT